MKGIKYIKEIFGSLSFDKTALSVVHVDGQKRKAGLPFIEKPAASHNCLRHLLVTEKIQDQKKDISFPSVIRVQLY